MGAAGSGGNAGGVRLRSGERGSSGHGNFKTCPRCTQSKPLSEYNKNKAHADGVGTYCRACESARRRKVEPTAPVPEVRTYAPPPPPSPKPPEEDLQRVLIIPDCHVPNHDERAWALLLRVGLWLKPDVIVVLGDFADGETLSAHPATKPGERDFEDEVVEVRKALDQLEMLGASRRIYIEGNHEFRLDRYLMSQAPAMFRSLRWQQLLDLERRGWEWVPYRKSVQVGKINFTHDVGSAGMNAHRVAAKSFHGSAVIGHTHRMSYEVTGRFEGSPYLGAMFGWLGNAEKAGGYLHEAKAADWVHGFGIGYLEPSGVVHVQPVPIVNGRCVVQGRLFA